MNKKADCERLVREAAKRGQKSKAIIKTFLHVKNSSHVNNTNEATRVGFLNPQKLRNKKDRQSLFETLKPNQSFNPDQDLSGQGSKALELSK